MSDEDLMAAVRGGDRDAFGELFGRYQERIWRFFRRRLADRSAAEELTQETFLAVLQGAARYEPRAPFRSYLFGIAFNLLAAARRRRSNSSLDGVNAAEPIAGSSDQVLVLWSARPSPVLIPMTGRFCCCASPRPAGLRGDRRAVEPASRHGAIAPVSRPARRSSSVSTRQDRRRSPDEAHPFVRP